jgi:competence protein ComFC
MRRGGEGLASLFYPPECILCGAPTTWGVVLCSACEARLPRPADPICAVCGEVLSDPLLDLCVRCGTSRRAFSGARALGPYDGSWSALIHSFKFEGEMAVGRWLASRMADRAREWIEGFGVSCVTYVPMTRSERNRRGFNPSRRLALGVGRGLGLPVARLLAKVRTTRPQRTLSAKDRAVNLRGVFRAVGSGRGAVLLVDDILTTGATADECSRALTEVGFDSVYVLTVART